MGENDILPGPEKFWQTSPELISLQPRLKQLWESITTQTPVPTGDIIDNPSVLPARKTDKSPSIMVQFSKGDLVAFLQRSREFSILTLLQLKDSPRIAREYPLKPYHVQHDHTSAIGPDSITLWKWKSGVTIRQGKL